MKSLFLLFFMIPTAVYAMNLDGFEEFPEPFPTLDNNHSLWEDSNWKTVDRLTDIMRQKTLTLIQQRLNATLQKIKSYSQRIPDKQREPVVSLLNQWLTYVGNNQQSLAAQTARDKVDLCICLYHTKEESIGKAVTSLEQALQSGNNSDSVDALENLMNSLSVTSLEEKLQFGNLSLGN